MSEPAAGGRGGVWLDPGNDSPCAAGPGPGPRHAARRALGFLSPAPRRASDGCVAVPACDRFPRSALGGCDDINDVHLTSMLSARMRTGQRCEAVRPALAVRRAAAAARGKAAAVGGDDDRRVRAKGRRAARAGPLAFLNQC